MMPACRASLGLCLLVGIELVLVARCVTPQRTLPVPGRWQLRMPNLDQDTWERERRSTGGVESNQPDLGHEAEADRDGQSWRIVRELLKLLHSAKWHRYVPQFTEFTRRPPPAWSYNWGAFPVYAFAQNVSGMESSAQLELDLRYALVIVDGLHNVMNVSDREEASIYEQCLALRSRRPSLVCVAYRQSWHALSNFAWSRRPAADPGTRPYWWVQDDRNQLLNTSIPDYNMWGVLHDWRNESSQMFYLQNTVAEALAEAPVVQGVFFDDFDGEGCLGALNASLPSRYDKKTLVEMYSSRIKLYGEVIKSLNAHNMVPILGMSTLFNTTSNGCLVPEEAVLEALGDEVGFIREAIFDRPVAQSTPQGCAEFMRSTLEEVSAGIPTLFWSHTTATGNLSSLAIPAFLIVRAQFSYFGASSGWNDKDWRWHPEYDRAYGTPLEPAQMTDNGMAFSRRYSNCVAIVDCAHLAGCVDCSKTDPYSDAGRSSAENSELDKNGWS